MIENCGEVTGSAVRLERGNLAQVRGRLKRGDIVDYQPINPLVAELVGGATPQWHVLETHPNQERIAAAHLIARRFGVFVPETEETVLRRGRRITQKQLLFSGYIFVFVWDAVEHLTRLEAIPGVARLILIDDKPAVISDEKIDEIRAVENSLRPLPPLLDDAPLIRSKKKRRQRKSRKAEVRERQQLEAQRRHDNEIVAVRSWSAFQDGLMALDSERRNQSLLKALGLSS